MNAEFNELESGHTVTQDHNTYKFTLWKMNKTNKILPRQGKKGEGTSKYQNENGDIDTDITEAYKKIYITSC